MQGTEFLLRITKLITNFNFQRIQTAVYSLQTRKIPADNLQGLEPKLEKQVEVEQRMMEWEMLRIRKKSMSEISGHCDYKMR